MPTSAERLARVEAVLFDLDGTLIDTVELILTSFRHATRVVLGESLPDEVMMAGVGMPLRQQMHDFSPEHADELLRVYREHNAEAHDRMVHEYPGTEAVLTELQRRGMPMGVVTSKGTPMTLRGLRLFGLERFFGVVVTADDVPLHKPDPYPLRHAAELLGVGIERCVYVGDSPHDMEAARASRAVAVAALWGAFGAEAVLAPGPDFAIASLPELLPLLDGGGCDASHRNS
ncbi:MAG TPA: HAD-IA family hydrolase [Coriobacteriia bacterium]|jgi:pyrophosphatase PpaX